MIRGVRTRKGTGCNVHTIYINILRTKFFVCVGEPDEEFCKLSGLNPDDYKTVNGLEWIHNKNGFIRVRDKDMGTLLHELYHLFQDMVVFEDKDEREFAAYLYEDVVNRIILAEEFKPCKEVKDFYIKD